MKNKFTKKHKHVLIIKGTQGMAMLSLAAISGLNKYLKSSAPCARALSRLWTGSIYNVRRRASSISCARVLSLLGVLVIASSLFIGATQLRSEQAQAATSNTLNFQGRLLTASGALVADGTYNVQFNLYYVSTAGTTQWTETRTNQGGNPVSIQNGYYSVYLGDTTTGGTAFPSGIDWSQDLYLGMTIRGTGSCSFAACTPTDSEMTPRFKLTAVPYALRAANVASSDTNAASSNTDGITIETGDALGATSNSGSISLNVGSATGTRGAINIGNGTNAPSSILIGQTGVTTTIQGSVSLSGTGTALTVTNNATISGSLTVSTLGSADTSTFVCRNSSSQLATCSSTPLTNALTDNVADAFDLQEGTNNYININTTNLLEEIQFGNTTTNPYYSFLGTGISTFSGVVNVTDGTDTVSLNPNAGSITIDSTNQYALLVQETGTSTDIFSVDTNSVGGYGINIGGYVTASGDLEAGWVTGIGGLSVGDGSANFVDIVSASQSSDYSVTIPVLAGNDTFCLLSNNCGYIASSLTDNITNSLDLQEGTNNYININTTNSSENISFGNATTNPSFNFLGAGTLGVAGNLAVDTDTLFVNSTSNFVGIGTTSAANSILNVASNAGAANSGSIIQASGTLGYTTGAGELQYAFKTFSNVTPTTAASGSYFGGVFGPQGTSTTNLTNATIGGVYGIGTYTGASGSLGDAIGGRFTVNNSAAGTITRAYGLQIPNFTNPSGTITNRAGLQIDGFTTASTNSTLVLLGTSTIPSADFSIYNASAQDNVFQGNLAVGSITAPTAALDVTGDGIFSGNLTVNGNTTLGNAVTDGLTVTAAIQGTSALLFDGSSDDTNETTLSITNPSADRTQTLQDNSGVIPLGTAGNTLFFTTSGATNITLPTSGTLLSNSLTDNVADAFDLQEGTNNYININTTNSSENISFGNATTNPSYSFLGSGRLTVNGGISSNANLSTPFGGLGDFTNRLFYSEQFDNATWTKSNVTAPTANNTVANAPNETDAAEILVPTVAGGYVQQDTSIAIGSTYTFSVWVKTASGTTTGSLRIDGTTTGTGTAQSFTATTSWQRVSVTQNTTGFTGNVRVRIFPGGTGGTGTIDAWGAQLNTGSTPNVYINTNDNDVVNTTTINSVGTIGAAVNGTLNLANSEGNSVVLSAYSGGAGYGQLRVSAYGTGNTIADFRDQYGSVFSIGDTVSGASVFNSGLTANNGLTVIGGTVNLNASSNNNTNINTGTSTGTVAIGNSLSTLNVLGVTNINTSGSTTTTIGNASAVLNINGTTTVAAGFSQTGANTFSTGTGAISLNGATSITGTNTLTVGTGLTTLGGALSVSGLTTVSTLGSADTSTFVCRNSSSQLATCSTSPLTNSLTDNVADAFDLQEGTNNYININTTNSSENISFGNATTNPSYSFLGSGTVTASGLLRAGSGGTNGYATAGGDLYVQDFAEIDGGLRVEGTVPDSAFAALANIEATASSSTNGQRGIQSNLTVSPGSASTQTYVSFIGQALSGSSNLTGGTINGVRGQTAYSGTGTLGSAYGIQAVTGNSSTGIISTNVGVNIASAQNTGGGTITSNYGIYVNDQTAGTGDYGIYIQGADTYALWVDNDISRFDGQVIVGGTGTPSVATGDGELYVLGDLEVDANTDLAGTLTVAALTTLNGGLTVQTGDTFTFNGDAFTDFTGGGLVNTGGVLTVDVTSAAGFFQNGGNSFGGTATLGTNDANALAFETGGTTQLTVTTGGNLEFNGTGTLSTSSGDLFLQGSSKLDLKSGAGSSAGIILNNYVDSFVEIRQTADTNGTPGLRADSNWFNIVGSFYDGSRTVSGSSSPGELQYELNQYVVTEGYSSRQGSALFRVALTNLYEPLAIDQLIREAVPIRVVLDDASTLGNLALIDDLIVVEKPGLVGFRPAAGTLASDYEFINLVQSGGSNSRFTARLMNNDDTAFFSGDGTGAPTERIRVLAAGGVTLTGNTEVASGNFEVDTADDTLYVDASGNRVGIGNTGSTGKLSVSGATANLGLFESTGANNAYLTVKAPASQQAGILLNTNNTDRFQFGVQTDNSFFLYDNANSRDAINIASGNITLNGIGGNVTLGNSSGGLTLSGIVQGANAVVFEGASADAFETTFTITDPTADRAIVFQDNSGVVPLSTPGNSIFFNTAGSTTLTLPTSGTVTVNPVSGSYLLQVPTATADNTITPTANSVTALTVNGTSGTAATAVSIIQGGAATALNINGTSTGSLLTLQDNGTSVLTVADGGVTTITANGGTGVALTVNNGTSTGNILNVQDNGTSVLTVADGGNLAVDTNTLFVDATNNYVGIGTASPDSPLTVTSSSLPSGSGAAINVDATSTFTGSGSAIYSSYTVSPGSASTANYAAVEGRATSASSNLTLNTSLAGLAGRGTYTGTGTIRYVGGADLSMYNSGTGTVSRGYGLWVASGTNNGGGTITGLTGVSIEAQSAGTNNTNLLIGNGGTIPTGNWSIYNASTNNNVFAGNLRVGATTAPTVALDVTGSGAFTGNLSVGAGSYLSLAGGVTGTRPASPTEGMVYYDTTTDELLIYANGKWQSDRTDAVLVAASNSSQNDKDIADYVGDGDGGGAGNGDQVEINAALTAASGRKVILLAGTYVADATILIPNNTTLTGVGRGTLIELGNLDATDNLIENSDTSTGTGVVIRDMRLDGRVDLNTAGTQRAIFLSGMGNNTGSTSVVGAKVTGIYSTDFRNEIIYLNNSDNNIVNDNYTYGGEGSIYLSGSNNNNISNNTLSYVSGATLTGGIVLVSTSTDNVVDGNNITSDDGAGSTYAGIYNTSADNIITNNTVSVSLAFNAAIESSGNNAVISGNVLSGSSSPGMVISGSNYTVSNNSITSQSTALTAGGTNGLVSNNSITSTAGIGVSLTGTNTTLTGNRIFNTGGATANNALSITGDDNQVTANQFTDTSCTTTCVAITISAGADRNYLSGNRHTGTAANPSTISDSGLNTTLIGQNTLANSALTTSAILQAKGSQVLTGSIDPIASTAVTGVGTSFTTELEVGDRITVSGETRTVTVITSATSLTVDTAFSNNANDTAVDRLPASVRVRNSSSTTQLIVQDNGFVGFGTAAPASALDIVSSVAAEIRLTAGGSWPLRIGQDTSSNFTINNNNSTNFSIRGSDGNVGIKTTSATADLSFGDTADRTINVNARSTNAAGNALTVSAGAAGAGATGFAGGILTLNGGAAAGTTGNANGGNVVIAGGAGVNSGTRGLVVITNATYSTTAVQNFTGSAVITQANIDSSGAILISSNAAGYTATLSDPTITTAGRVVYVTNSGTFDMTLSVNGGGSGNTVTLKPSTTATMIWGGSDWTAAGASSSTDLQAAYNNTATSAGGAELVLNAPGGAADGLTIRNNATTPIIGGILEVQTSIGSNLLTVNNNATEYATNGGGEASGTSTCTSGFPANTWTTTTGGTCARYTTTGDNVATGQASVSIVTTTTNHGLSNRLSTSLTSGLTYTVSFAVRGTTNFSTLQVLYSPDGTTSGTTTCATGQTVTSGQWTRVVCSFTAAGTITSSNAILIRQTDATGRTFYVDNLSVNVNASANHAADGSVDNSGAFATNWTDYQPSGTATESYETSFIYDTAGSAQVDTSATAGIGLRNNLAITPQISTQYLVSFYMQPTSTMTGSVVVGFLPAGGTGVPSGSAACTDYNTQTATANVWTKITCLFTTPGAGISNPDLVIYQSDTTARTFYVDALSITLNTNNSNNVQIGGANKGGPVTLFTLDRSNGAPIAANNEAYLGSMYYDTSTGRIQCYEADGWGACGAAPDNIVNLNPEYAGAVLNGTGVGTMTADFCSNDTALSVNSTLCSTGQAKNYYRWTSPQATQQTYSIYVTYQLPSTFNDFASDDTVQLVARTDSTTNAAVTYEMFNSNGSTVTQCGTGETTVVTTANTWQSVGVNGNEATGSAGCSFAASSFIIFKINMKANSNANAYVSTLSFTTTGR